MTDQSDPGANYPRMPEIRPEELTTTPAGAPPPTVIRAVQLMFVSAALGLIGLILTIATRDTLREQILEDDPNVQDIDAVVTAAIVVSVVVGLLFIGLWVLLALMIRKGRNWARIVTWVVASVGLLLAVVGLFDPPSALSAILTALGGIIDVAVIVLLAMRPSNEFFARATGRR